ncbi:aconitase X [Salinarimonas sp.]|uniref:aconitase X n=1 Tax=Salinarimonas sp. TaxID=2766526 RepID=UPI00391C7E3F
MDLTAQERAIAAGAQGEAAALAMRLVSETGRLLGAPRLIPVASAHIDGALYHGDSGVLFAERLVAEGGRVAVPASLNVGALDLMRPGNVRLPAHQRDMAKRLMRAYEALGCRPTWTCAPYQAGHRPRAGTDVAWGESNAVAFCNSVLGARTNRYGDFLDIACALVGRAPLTGLHLPENRRPSLVVDLTALSARLRRESAFFPVLGAWLGRRVGSDVALLVGLDGACGEDDLKALGAAAASSGAVGLFHVAGVTPEAREWDAHGFPDLPRIVLDAAALLEARARLSSAGAGVERIDAVAIGSPHASADECAALLRRLAGRRVAVPFYVNTGRHVIAALDETGARAALEEAGITFVVDTCIVVTPILSGASGVLMTNSGKFAHYAPGNTGWETLYGSLGDCVESAVSGRVVRDEELWR